MSLLVLPRRLDRVASGRRLPRGSGGLCLWALYAAAPPGDFALGLDPVPFLDPYYVDDSD